MKNCNERVNNTIIDSCGHIVYNGLSNLICFTMMTSNRIKYLSNLQNETKPSAILSTSQILNFLNDEELLSHRLVCRSSYQATQQILGPYDNFIQFILGTTQFFVTKEEFKLAWGVYKKSVESKSVKPALLYKSNDFSVTTVNFLKYEFSEGEKVFENGRLYQCIPVESYTWKHNAAWLLGNIHHGRPFLSTSPFIRHFIFRTDLPQEYSAWSREVACLTKAGYRITHINSKGFMTFSPCFPDQIKRYQIKETMIDSKQIKNSLELVLADVYEKNRVLVSNATQDPKPKDFEYHSLIVRQKSADLKVFLLKNQKIIYKSIATNNIKNILKLLPPAGQSSDNPDLIKEILSNYNFTLIKKNKQLYIDKQITPAKKNCLIM